MQSWLNYGAGVQVTGIFSVYTNLFTNILMTQYQSHKSRHQFQNTQQMEMLLKIFLTILLFS